MSEQKPNTKSSSSKPAIVKRPTKSPTRSAPSNTQRNVNSSTASSSDNTRKIDSTKDNHTAEVLYPSGAVDKTNLASKDVITSSKVSKTSGVVRTKVDNTTTKKAAAPSTNKRHSVPRDNSKQQSPSSSNSCKKTASSLGKRKVLPEKCEGGRISAKKSCKNTLPSLEDIVKGRNKLVLGSFLGNNYVTFTNGSVLKLNNAISGDNSLGLRRLPKNRDDIDVINQTGEINIPEYREFLEENYEIIKDCREFSGVKGPDKLQALSNLTELWCSPEGFLVPLSKIRPIVTKSTTENDTADGKDIGSGDTITMLELLPIDEYYVITISNLGKHPLYCGAIGKLRQDNKFKELVIASGNLLSSEDVLKGLHVPDSFYIFYCAERITTKCVIANGKQLFLKPLTKRGDEERIAGLEDAMRSHTVLLIGTGQDTRNIELVFKSSTLSFFSESVNNSSIISPSYNPRPVTGVSARINPEITPPNQTNTHKKTTAKYMNDCETFGSGDITNDIDSKINISRSPKLQSPIGTSIIPSTGVTSVTDRNPMTGSSTSNHGIHSLGTRHVSTMKINTIPANTCTNYPLDNSTSVIIPNASKQNSQPGYAKDYFSSTKNNPNVVHSSVVVPPFIYHKSYEDLHPTSQTELLYKALSSFTPRDSSASDMIENCKSNISTTIDKLTELSKKDPVGTSDTYDDDTDHKQELLSHFANLVGSAFIMGSLTSHNLFITPDI